MIADLGVFGTGEARERAERRRSWTDLGLVDIS